MAEQRPTSNKTLTPARITLLVLGVLAILMILGGIFGGVTNYEFLHEASPAAAPSANPAP